MSPPPVVAPAAPWPAPTADERAALARYVAARDWIDVELVRLGKRRLDNERKRAEALAFYAALGDPQRAAPAVQVAGTSGKGSVAMAIALGLDAAGLRTGLTVSPYLQAYTEKLWVAGAYCDPLAFARAADAVRPAVAAISADGEAERAASTHGLAGLGTIFLAFREARLDVAVVETGVGGRFDLVQGLDRALSVITDLGLDHEDVLGAGLPAVASHKAGIVEARVPAVAIAGPGSDVIAAEARRVGAPLVLVRPEAVARDLGAEGERRRVLLHLPTLGDVEVRLPRAPFQLRNAAVAAASLDLLAARGWPLRGEHVAAGLERLRVPGRLEVVDPGPGHGRAPVILDGAHNPQKLAALAGALVERLGPDPGCVLVAASTGGRDPAAAVEALGPLAHAVVATAPRLHGKDVASPAALVDAARARGLRAEAVLDPTAAVSRALELAGGERPVVVTGSLYLVGVARDRWFPWEQVVLQRTSWPVDGGSRGA